MNKNFRIFRKNNFVKVSIFCLIVSLLCFLFLSLFACTFNNVSIFNVSAYNCEKVNNVTNSSKNVEVNDKNSVVKLGVLSKKENASTIPNDTQILNDNTYIDSNLWTALYNVYISQYGIPAENALYPNSFANFPISELNLSVDAQSRSYQIKSIEGLEIFDLSAFTSVNLSENNIETITDGLKSLTNLQQLDLSNNRLTNFSDEILCEQCKSVLTNLNISGNNISDCDISNLANANINLSNNNLSDSNFQYNSTAIINVSFNYIFDVTDFGENIQIGFQGAKNGENFESLTTILFYQFDTATKAQILEGETVLHTLTNGQSKILQVGNYTIKFFDEQNTEITEHQISFSVLMPNPTATLFQNNNEVEFSTKIYKDSKIVFEGEEGAKIYISVNDGSFVESDSVNISKNGTTIIKVYQTKDGYQSAVSTYYVILNKANVGSWIIIILGILGIVLIYFAYMYITKKIFSKGVKNKSKLD